MGFKSDMEKAKKQKNSSLILALDTIPCTYENILPRALEILEAVNPYICALKINRHLVLSLGLFQVSKLILDKAHEIGLPVIMDCKINDIGYTNRVIAGHYFNSGFDAVTVNPFVGWKDGVQPVFEIAKQMDRGVILLGYMSHKSSWEGYGQKVYDPKKDELKPQYIVFAEKAVMWNADGFVVGGTYPQKIKEVYKILGSKIPIYSPGFGFQGGSVREAIESGTCYIIIGRTITMDEKPKEIAKKFRKEALI